VLPLRVKAGPGGLAAGEIGERRGIPASRLSFHMKTRSHAGLLQVRPESRFNYYSANFESMNALLGYLTDNCCGGRACALGGSYGCFMDNWIAGNWSGPWKCLVNHDGIFDARFMGYSTEELWFAEWENGGTPWSPNTTYQKFNPAVWVQNWSKPTLVIHACRDSRVPPQPGTSITRVTARVSP